MEKDKFVPEEAVELAEGAEEVAGDFEEVENEQELNALYGELGRIAMSEDEFEEDDESELESGLEGAERGAEEVKDAEEGERKTDVNEEGREEFLRELEGLNRETERAVNDVNRALRQIQFMLELDELNRETDETIAGAEKAIREAKLLIGEAEREKDRQITRQRFGQELMEVGQELMKAERAWMEWRDEALKVCDELRQAANERRYFGDEVEFRVKKLGNFVAEGSQVLYQSERAKGRLEDMLAYGSSRGVLEESEGRQLQENNRALGESLAEKKQDKAKIEEAYESYRKAYYLQYEVEDDMNRLMSRLRWNF